MIRLHSVRDERTGADDHPQAYFALVVALIITVKLVKWAKRWELMAVA
jgi:hypothetical protein